MCFCNNNNFLYCDKCQDIYEALKVSNISNKNFNELLRMIKNTKSIKMSGLYSPFMLVFYIISTGICGIVLGIFIGLMII